MHDAAPFLPARSAHALLSLLRFTSPTLPIGAYAYSRGLEHAVHASWVHDEPSALAWIAGIAEHTFARLDLPIVARLHAAHAADDHERTEHHNRWLLTSRESAELRLEETQLGSALARLLVGLGVESARAWLQRDDACYGTLFALAAVAHGIERHDALLGFAWALCESQTSVAVRLVPLGQSAGQRILGQLVGRIPTYVDLALSLAEHEIGALAPGLSLGSALHETQYTRLFRS